MRFPFLSLATAALALLSACSTVPSSPPSSSPSPSPSSRPLPPGHPRVAPEFWIDLVQGNEVTDDAVLADLAGAGVVFIGEAHTIARHHAVQLRLLQELFARGVPLVLCLEQLEARDQPAVDRFNRHELDFDGLAREIGWAKKWSNHADYRALCDFAQQHRIPLHALNAPAEVIRAVSRGGGLARLPTDQRAQLPAEIVADDPLYERLMNLELSVHAAMDPAKLRPVFEAQVARDETMAANLVAARRVDTPPDRPRTAVALIGAGHMRFGLGTAARVRRREPAIVERLVLITDSGQLKMSAADKAATRDVDISHADLRALGRPPGDYLRVLPRAAAAAAP